MEKQILARLALPLFDCQVAKNCGERALRTDCQIMRMKGEEQMHEIPLTLSPPRRESLAYPVPNALPMSRAFTVQQTEISYLRGHLHGYAVSYAPPVRDHKCSTASRPRRARPTHSTPSCAALTCRALWKSNPPGGDAERAGGRRQTRIRPPELLHRRQRGACGDRLGNSSREGLSPLPSMLLQD